MDKYLFSNDLVQSNRIIYTPSLFAKQSLIYLQETGDLVANAPHISKREKLSSYLFFIVVSGSGQLRYENKAYMLHKNDCVFIDCQKPYEQSSSLDLWHLKWVHFDGINCANIYQKYLERGGQPVFSSQQSPSYIEVLDQIFEIAQSQSYIKDMKLFEQFTHLFSLLMKDSWNPDTKKETSKYNLEDIKKFIDENWQHKISLDQLANHFYINKYYLSRIFKEQYGITINHYINESKITHAKQELRFSASSIEQIAQNIGIEDANYFSRLFKKIEGVTPSQYRKTWMSSRPD